MRILNFYDGFDSETEPTDGIVTVTGSRAAPVSVTTAGITPLGKYHEIIFVKGAGGVPVTITANPSIAAGTRVGDILELCGCDDTATLTINHGNGTDQNGPATLMNGGFISYRWDGSNWQEAARRGDV